MFRLKQLKIKAFRSFTKESVIDFSENGLILVDGTNSATSESSGTGKSSIFLAIAYVLDIMPTGFSGMAQQSWHTEEPLKVELFIDKDEDCYQFVRGKGLGAVYLNGKQVAKGAKGLNDYLLNFFGVDNEILALMVYKHQKTDSLFLRKTDKEKKQFLSKILGLDKIEDLIEYLNDSIKKTEQELLNKEEMFKKFNFDPVLFDKEKIEKTKQLISEQLSKNLEEIARINSSGDLIAKEIRELKDKKEKILSNRYKWANEDLFNKRKALISQLEKDDLLKKEQIDLQRKALQKASFSFDIEIKEQNGLLKQIEDIKRQIEKLKQNTCPTCDQTVVNNNALNKIQEVYDFNIVKIKDIEVLQKEKTDTEQKIDACIWSPDSKVIKGKEILNEMIKEERQLSSDFESKKIDQVRQLDKEIESKRSLFNVEITENIQRIEKNNIQLKNELDKNNGLAKVFGQIQEYQVVIEDCKQKILINKELVNMVGYNGFLGAIFFEILKEIEQECNQRLFNLVNVSGVTIELLYTQTEKKDKIITPMVYVNGNRADLSSGLSGGMLTSLEQAVDLSIIEVLQRRLGKFFGWYAIDEAFEGQGNATKDSALELLKTFSSNRVVMVIDHNNDFKEKFSKVIKVIQNGSESHIEKNNEN